MSRKRKEKEPVIPARIQRMLLLGTVAVLAVAGGVWAYFNFSTLAPPPMATATPMEVSRFLASPRGFANLNIDQREQYIRDTLTHFSTEQARQDLSRELARMSSADREVIQDAAFDIARDRFMKKAREFNKTSKGQSRQFVDSAIRDFESMKKEFSVAGNSGQKLTDPFKQDMPTSKDGWMKLVVTNSTPRERSEAQNFADQLAARQQELKNPRERALFDGR